MLKYLYNYQVATQFAQAVTTHTVMLRCQPATNTSQRLEQEHVVLPGIFRMSSGTDAFGNRILYGTTREPHQSLIYVSTGIAAQGEYCIPDSAPAPYYRMPSRLTFPSAEIMALQIPGLDSAPGTSLDKSGDIPSYEKALLICHVVNKLLEYESHTTLVTTSAAEALKQGKGVCQDYAHLMISLCRLHGLTARYANGFIIGEGETHAWVEVHDGYAWRAFDPTHDTPVCSGYIKLAHGRDAIDCTVDRGTFVGPTSQETHISVTLLQCN